MKRTGFYLATILILSACQSSLPKNVLKPEQMQAILWDLMRADELATSLVISDSSNMGLAKHEELYLKVFALHKTNQKQFSESMRYYQNHPAYLKPVLDSIQQSGE